MRTITQEDARLNPAFAEYVGKTLSVEEINKIANSKEEKKEDKKADKTEGKK